MNKKTFLIAIIILIIDQVVKSIVEIFLDFSESVEVIRDFFYITVVHNEGGAWSILENYSYLFIVFSIIAMVVLIKFMFSFKRNGRNNLAFGLTMGGILSNLADRIFLGYVRDFLDFRLGSYNYPIFNIADIAIVLGVVLLSVAIIKGEDRFESNG